MNGNSASPAFPSPRHPSPATPEHSGSPVPLSTSPEPRNPSPCPSSWSTIVTKSNLSGAGVPVSPKSNAAWSLLNVASMS